MRCCNKCFLILVLAREGGSGSEQGELSLTLHRRHLCEVERELDEEGCASALKPE